MQLPKYQKKERVKLKVCHEPECGREYWGHPISKYCEQHREIRNRTKRKRLGPQYSGQNIEINHSSHDVLDMHLTCSLEGCGKQYIAKLFPKQTTYPMYCEEHRNEFRRAFFTRQRKKQLQTEEC